MENTHQQVEYYYIRFKNTCGVMQNPLACVCIIKHSDGTYSRGISIYSEDEHKSFNKKLARHIAYSYAVAACSAPNREITSYILSDNVRFPLDVAKNSYDLYAEKYWIDLTDGIDAYNLAVKNKSIKPVPKYYISQIIKRGYPGIGMYYKGRAGMTEEFLSDYEKKILDTYGKKGLR